MSSAGIGLESLESLSDLPAEKGWQEMPAERMAGCSQASCREAMVASDLISPQITLVEEVQRRNSQVVSCTSFMAETEIPVCTAS